MCTVLSYLVLSFKTLYNISCPDQLVDYLICRSRMHDRNLSDKTLSQPPKVKKKPGQTTVLQQQIDIVFLSTLEI